MFETSKHVPKTEKCCCLFKDKSLMFNKITIQLLRQGFTKLFNSSTFTYFD